MSIVAAFVAMTSCNSNSSAKLQKEADNASFRQEKEFLNDAIRHKSPDVQTVEIIDSTVVFTHIYDGIIDVKAYSFDGDRYDFSIFARAVPGGSTHSPLRSGLAVSA